MLFRYICTVTLIAFLNSVIGCTSNVRVSMDEVYKQPPQPIHSVVLVSGDEVTFDEQGGRIDVERKVIAGVTIEHRKGRRWIGGDPVEIKLSDVKYFKVKKPSTIKTVFAVAGSIAGILIVASIIFVLSDFDISLN